MKTFRLSLINAVTKSQSLSQYEAVSVAEMGTRTLTTEPSLVRLLKVRRATMFWR